MFLIPCAKVLLFLPRLLPRLLPRRVCVFLVMLSAFLVPPAWGQWEGATVSASMSAPVSAPVAQLLLVRPLVRLAKGGVTKDARSLDALRVGDRVAAMGGGASLVFYQSGKRFQIAPGTEVVVQKSDLRTVKGAKPVALASVSRRLLRPIEGAVQSNRRIGPQFGGQILRSVGDEKVPQHFLTLVVSPAFLPGQDVIIRWKPGDLTPMRVGVMVFHVLPENQKEAGPTVADVDTAACELKLPASLFVAGEKYVVMFNDGPAPPSVPVRVLDKAVSAEVAAGRAEMAAMKRSGKTDTSPELLLALFLESYGLREEARAVYTDALKRNPSDAEAARWLRVFAP